MNKQELKQLLKHPSIEKVMFENHVRGEVDYKTVPCEVSKYHPNGPMTVRVFKPFLDSSIWAEHWCVVRLSNSRYMWISLYRSDSGELIAYFDYVWKAGVGKKMRKDAAWNLYYSMFSEMNDNVSSLPAVSEPKKIFNIMYNVGQVKYLVNFNDGVQTHKDGSLFFDIRTTNNKKKLTKIVSELKKQGFTETSNLN